MKLSKSDVNEILHAAGAARVRGHMYQCNLLVEIARDYSSKIGVKIEELSWYSFSQGHA
jgi:hypothetical protein